MNDIGVGDWVECVDEAPGMITGETGLLNGAIYCVAEVEEAFHGRSMRPSVGLYLVGEVRRACGWDISRFRPIYRPSDSLIEGLKCPVLIGIDPAHGEDCGAKVTVKVHPDGIREIIDVEYVK